MANKLPHIARFLAVVARRPHIRTIRSIPMDSPSARKPMYSQVHQHHVKKVLRLRKKLNSSPVKKVANPHPAKMKVTNKISLNLHISVPGIAMLIHLLKELF